MELTLTIELTAEEEARVRTKAQAEGKPVEQFVRDLIDGAARAGEPAPEMTWGARLMAEMEADPDYPIWTDLPEDGPELARKLRQMAEQRGPVSCE